VTGKADFSQEEWDLVREGPPTAGMIALTASRGGSFRETWALAKTYAEARQQHGASQLLDDLVADKPDVKRYRSGEELEKTGLGRLGDAVALLGQKATPEELEAYKRFTIGVAERVAAAHKEEGESVSGAEGEAIQRITATLNPS
jgi:hypothetical protein